MSRHKKKLNRKFKFSASDTDTETTEQTIVAEDVRVDSVQDISEQIAGLHLIRSTVNFNTGYSS